LAGALIDRLRDGLISRGRALHHAATVITVAGNRVDAAEFLFGVGQHRRHRLERAGHEPAAVAAVLVGELGQMRCSRRCFGVRVGALLTGLPGGRRGALAVCRGVGRRGPILSELVVQPHDRQRAAGHIQARDQLPHFGLNDFVAAIAQQPRHLAPQDEQFFVLGAAKSVQDHRDSL
jgi:hypothetical protein